MGDVRELCALADAHQVDVEAAGTDRRGKPRLVTGIRGMRDRAFETRRVGVGQVVGDDVELPLAGQHAGHGDALRNFHLSRPYLLH